MNAQRFYAVAAGAVAVAALLAVFFFGSGLDNTGTETAGEIARETLPIEEGEVQAREFREEITVPIIVYHRIEKDSRRSSDRPYTVTPDEFKEQMSYLSDGGFTTLTVSQLNDHFFGEPLPEKPVVITFDDGRDTQYEAWKVLERRGFVASFFPFTNAMGRPGYMTWEQLGEIAAGGGEIGSHTVFHPYLTKSTDSEAVWELERSAEDIEKRLGERPKSISWPFGLKDERVIGLADGAGYEFGRGLEQTSTHAHSNRMELGSWIVTGDFERFKRIVDPSP